MAGIGACEEASPWAVSGPVDQLARTRRGAVGRGVPRSHPPRRRRSRYRRGRSHWTRGNDVEIDLWGLIREPVAEQLLFLGSIKRPETAPFDAHDLAALHKHRAALTAIRSRSSRSPQRRRLLGSAGGLRPGGTPRCMVPSLSSQWLLSSRTHARRWVGEPGWGMGEQGSAGRATGRVLCTGRPAARRRAARSGGGGW